MKKTDRKPKERSWAPKCRAETFKDKRLKRLKTRADKFRNSLKEQ